MSSRYRVDYYIKEHRRDEFIEWIKSLLATPFVLYAVKPNFTVTAVQDLMINSDAARRYAEIFHDIEKLVLDHMEMTKLGISDQSRIIQLVPSIGTFFTPLPLEQAFYIQDQRRGISKRRLVAPSFNDIRLILNTAQILQLAIPFHETFHENSNNSTNNLLSLITFDGDITLYDDGKNFDLNSPLLPHILTILKKNIVVGIVTAAGYIEAEKYHERLSGLLNGITKSEDLTIKQKENLLVMGGEANFLFRYNNEIKGLQYQDDELWKLPIMKQWSNDDLQLVLDFAQENLENLISKLSLDAIIVRKERAVGLIPKEGKKLFREQLEEVVLRVDHNLRQFKPAKSIKWCAFNGGSDIWVDIGDKSLGVNVLQQFIKKNDDIHVGPENTLHVGDQFASLGSNDYASRTAATTAWISSPEETCSLLKDLISFIDEWASLT
ncbi:IMP 5'-nucleotidase [Pichia californica]|uniref:IMP-specific 5'-nucleotidase 1 n=1 Tax=Pichia californica TaxID=460514 RepID=A0A9P6WJ59_9ASCO|nr:IMP 5'-nucleotidase [[Candida] californica]KAG0687897.1 IMP 5'-nucleotidase [[Candida] californica]